MKEAHANSMRPSNCIKDQPQTEGEDTLVSVMFDTHIIGIRRICGTTPSPTFIFDQVFTGGEVLLSSGKL